MEEGVESEDAVKRSFRCESPHVGLFKGSNNLAPGNVDHFLGNIDAKYSVSGKSNHVCNRFSCPTSDVEDFATGFEIGHCKVDDGVEVGAVCESILAASISMVAGNLLAGYEKRRQVEKQYIWWDGYQGARPVPSSRGRDKEIFKWKAAT